MKRILTAYILIFANLLVWCLGLQAAIHIELNVLQSPWGDTFDSHAKGVNRDGSVVVGNAGRMGGRRGFKWDIENGLVGIGEGSFFMESAMDVSDDGSVIVGRGTTVKRYLYEPARWQANTTRTVSLGRLLGSQTGAGSWACAITGDGSIIVGSSQGEDPDGSKVFEAFRWDSTDGMIGLGDLEGGRFKSSARDISDDGTVIVGNSSSSDNLDSTEAFRWEESTGMVGLGYLDNSGTPMSVAYGVSDDGSIIVGVSTSGYSSQAFMWTQAEGMIPLDNLHKGRNTGITAYDISGNGSIIVGHGQSHQSAYGGAYMWRKEDGYKLHSLNDFLDAHGFDRNGFDFVWAEAISGDGSTIVGMGRIDSMDRAFVLKIMEIPTWDCYQIINDAQDIDTGDWLGWINVWHTPYIWSYTIDSWIYMEEPVADAQGAWGYFYK